MEIKILDSILHGELKPWKIDSSNTRRFTELIKSAKEGSPDTNGDLLTQLTILLSDYPALQKVLREEAINNNKPLQQLPFKIDLPKYKDTITQFYYFVITKETLRVFNTFLSQAVSWTEPVDIRYQASKMLTNIKVLAKQTTDELKERNFTILPDEQSDFVHFALYYLKHSLIVLYFSLQEKFSGNLQQITTPEDFYLLDLQEPLSNSLKLEHVEPDNEPDDKKKKGNHRLSFEFKGDKSSLKTVLSQLSLKLDLVNETTNTADELFQLLTSKDIKPGSIKINIACETVEFRYIVDLIKIHFDNLTFAAIGKSQCFYSKNGTLYNAQNLYSSKISTPKTKEEIDSIIKQLK
jgi:hypothetical protein